MKYFYCIVLKDFVKIFKCDGKCVEICIVIVHFMKWVKEGKWEALSIYIYQRLITH